MNTPVARPRVVAKNGRRDLIIAIGVGVAILAFVIYAFVNLSRQSVSAGGVEGVIIAKNFVPQQETQITFGKGGVHSREVAGEYSFQVRVPVEKDKLYKVTVDPFVYNSHTVGDRYYLVHGPAAAKH